MRSIISFLLLCLTALSVSAQTYVVNGRATDGKEPLAYANVLMQNSEDTLRQYKTATDDKGNYRIEVPKGKWLLRITYLGYTPYETNANVTDNIYVPDIKLDAQSVMLKGATVIGRSTTFDASGYTVNINSHPLLRDLKMDKALRLLPGVFGNDKSISVYNKNATIYLDGIFVPLKLYRQSRCRPNRKDRSGSECRSKRRCRIFSWSGDKNLYRQKTKQQRTLTDI